MVLPAHAGVILDNASKAFRLAKYYPHMRGWSSIWLHSEIDFDVLPAHAGVILINLQPFQQKPSITRTCGGDLDPGTLTDGNSTNYICF